MNTIKLLKAEITLLQDNIERVEKFVNEERKSNYSIYNSSIVGELKHRAVAMKKSLSKINSMSTQDFLNDK